MIDWIAAILVLIGSLFILLASIGLLRFEDVFSRMHATAKAGTLGGCVILLSAALTAESAEIAFKALATLLFLLVTAPIAAHLFSRSVAKLRQTEKLKTNALQGKYTSLGSLPKNHFEENADADK